MYLQYQKTGREHNTLNEQVTGTERMRSLYTRIRPGLNNTFQRIMRRIYSQNIKLHGARGWLNQLSVQFLISAQVMISWFVSSSPALGSVLTAWSLLGILSPSLSALPYSLCLFLKINKPKKRFKKH